MEFVGGQVFASFEKCAENGVALRRVLQPDTLQVRMQNVFRLPHHLAGDAGLIVDSLLQHRHGLCHTGTEVAESLEFIESGCTASYCRFERPPTLLTVRAGAIANDEVGRARWFVFQ